MKSNIKMWKLMVLAGAILFLSDIAYAKSRTQDSVPGYGIFRQTFYSQTGRRIPPGVYIPYQLIPGGGQFSMETFRMGLFRPPEIFIPVQAQYMCRPDLRQRLPRYRCRLLRPRKQRRTGKPDCRLRLSRSAHCAYHPTVVTQLRMELRCVLRLETL